MSTAKIFYFTLQDEQTKEEKLDWFEQTRFEDIPFDHITPDQKSNWINLTDNNFDSFLPLIDKDVKAGKSQEAVFQLFSRGIATQRDEWVYDFSKEALIERMKYFVEVYSDRLEKGARRDLDIKWDADLETYLERKIKKTFEEAKIIRSCCRPYAKQYLYFDKHFNGRTYQLPSIFPSLERCNQVIWIKSGVDAPYFHLAVEHIPDVLPNGGSQCLPLYRYDENGNRIDNITDWALEQFRTHYRDELAQSPGQTRGLSPLFPTDGSVQTRGLSPLFDRQGKDSNLWFVTFVTHNSRVSERMVTYGVEVGEPLIFSAEDQIFIAEKISEAAKRYGIAIAAFNVLPDHVHIVLVATTEKELNEHIRKIKGFSSHEFQRSQNWDKGQHVWAQKFNRQLIVNQTALTEILEYVWNNHIKHAERWGEELISTWENGLLDKGLKPLVEIVREGCTSIEDIFEPHRTRGLSPLPTEDSSEETRGLSPLSDRGNITKLDIFHYTYAVLHHPAYRTKYELNLKREFPRLPFYANFHQWATWGKALMDLHLNYETVEPYGLQRVNVGRKKSASDTSLQATLIPIDTPAPGKPIKRTTPKAKLKADKIEGKIILDTETTLEGIPAVAWEYKLGNRSALEWILDQYKEKIPKDPTIAKLFNTYKFADYKEHVIDLLHRVCTVSVRTMEIIQQMPDADAPLELLEGIDRKL